MSSKRPAQSMSRSALEEFSHLPYFRNAPKDGRTIFLNPFYDHINDEWILLWPLKPDKLQRMQGGEPVVSRYLGFQAADSKRDFELALGTFVTQHLSFPRVAEALLTLESDLHNCSAILEKYILISCRDKSQRDGMNLLLRTELEYLINAIRSVYDLFQKLSKHASALIKIIDPPDKHPIHDLPDSFADIVLYANNLRSAQEIQDKFRLPEPLAEFYAAEAPHFKWLRDLRNAIEHHGHTPQFIFDIDEGATISIRDKPWDGLPLWQEPKFIKHEHLGCLRAVFLYLVAHIIETTSRFVDAYTQSVHVLPNAIEPGVKFYVRNYFSHHLVALNSTLEMPWERPQI